MTARAGRRTLATVLACLGLLLAAHVAGAANASAHTELVSTAPADGGQLTTAPTDVTLTFSQPVGTELARVEVTGPAGDALQDGDPQVDGATVAQSLMPLDDGGAYTVTWRVVAADGHPISGTFSFTFTGDTDDPPSASAALPDDTAPT
ncbi:MAG TPA: copper resistance CopC family protein, partial [Actinomycetales bacterium]|nr:copper resistance CopC family protein [Actinomycetales bacterium]